MAGVIQWIKGKLISLEWWWNVYRGCDCKECADGYFFPDYGPAPHDSFRWGPDGPAIGTFYRPKEQWPLNYKPGKNEEREGLWFCPNPRCPNHINNHEWGREE